MDKLKLKKLIKEEIQNLLRESPELRAKSAAQALGMASRLLRSGDFDPNAVADALDEIAARLSSE